MLHDAIFYRQSKATLYQSCAPAVNESVQPEFLPWTASDTRLGSRNCLMEQVTTTGNLNLDVVYHFFMLFVSVHPVANNAGL